MSAAIAIKIAGIVDSMLLGAVKTSMKESLTPTKKEKLKKELIQYLQKHFENDEVVLGAVMERLRLDSVYEDAIRVRGDSAKLLDIRMEGYPDASSAQRVRAACQGCIGIMMAEIRTWPEYDAEIRDKTAKDVADTKQGIDEVKHTVSDINLKVSEQRQEILPSAPPPSPTAPLNTHADGRNPSFWTKATALTMCGRFAPVMSMCRTAMNRQAAIGAKTRQSC